MSYATVTELIAARPTDWLDVLRNDFKIGVVQDGDLVSLKYDQIESPMYEPVVQQCRGMVVDIARNRILAHPYNKFWNHGDPLAASIDWATANVLEKLDGSLMLLYWDDRTEEWAVASSGTPCASGSFGEADITFRDAFWNHWHALNMQPPGKRLRDVTFMFELCDQPNRIVVKHDKPRIVLHGARDIATGKELTLDECRSVATDCNWEVVRSYPIDSIEACLAAADALDPLQTEGFVVVDADFRRVKIKSPRYVILHHMKGAATPRRAIELWQTGEAEELLSHFPEMAPQILPIHERLDTIAELARTDIDRYGGSASRKEYADCVKHLPWSAVCFRYYGKTPTLAEIKESMRGQTLASLERLLEAH